MNKLIAAMTIVGAMILSGCGDNAELRRLCEQAIKRDLAHPESFSVVETRGYTVRDGGDGIIIKYQASGASSVTGGTPVTTCSVPYKQTPTTRNIKVLKDFDPYRYRQGQ